MAELAPACAGREWQIMFFVYIVKSLIKKWYYVGYSDNIERRLKEHNNGHVKSTKAYKQYELVFVQLVNSSDEARDLEKYLKVRWNKESLLDLIN